MDLRTVLAVPYLRFVRALDLTSHLSVSAYQSLRCCGVCLLCLFCCAFFIFSCVVVVCDVTAGIWRWSTTAIAASTNPLRQCAIRYFTPQHFSAVFRDAHTREYGDVRRV